MQIGVFNYYFGFQRAICRGFILYQFPVNSFRYFVELTIVKIYTLDKRQLKNKNIFAILISSTAEEELISLFSNRIKPILNQLL